ncbi:MAG: biotin--[acetyl-CoA-carboxylase] ligase [Acidobacteria bacterium]|nr:biotin--[acetyl-CoA-carboxylase] ligase [Acidobacteriota bacterium]
MSRVIWRERLDSTMTEAARLAAEGIPNGTVVAARMQTAGQGRQGREWLSASGDGLYCTFILRLAEVPAITLALGLAVVEALTPIVGSGLDIRWPNDVLWQGKKLCGILARLEHGVVLAGIGINLNQLQFPPGLRTPATSLRLATSKTFDAEEVLNQLLGPVDQATQLNREEILRLFAQTSSYVSGRRVRVDLDGSILEGVTDGLDEFGFLRIRKENGARETVYAGSVRPLK